MAIANTGHEVILSGVLSAFGAQIFKVLSEAVQTRRINFRLFFETGGMPSSHSSTVTALATSVGIISGTSSVVFAVSVCLASIVMYDAAGLRRAAGKMAAVLNQITEDLYTSHPEKFPARMRELLGHTPVEVIMGALLGFALAYFVHYFVV